MKCIATCDIDFRKVVQKCSIFNGMDIGRLVLMAGRLRDPYIVGPDEQNKNDG